MDPTDSESQAHGKDVLRTLVHAHRQEYDELTGGEKAQLIQEFDEHKATKTCGFRTSMKSRVNDVTHTLKAVENEVSCAHFWGFVLMYSYV